MRCPFVFTIVLFLFSCLAVNAQNQNILVLGSVVADQDSVNALVLEKDTTIEKRIYHKNPVKHFKPEDEIGFLLGSCALIGSPVRERIFTSMHKKIEKESIDFMLWMGDAVYLPDKLPHEPKKIAKWHEENVLDIETYKAYKKHFTKKQRRQFTSAIPNYACPDDHDLGCNNTNANYAHIHESTSCVFKHFFPNDQYPEDKMYYSYIWGDTEFFLLDLRSYATDKVWLGEEQVNWLEQELVRSQKNPAINFRFIVSGIPVINTIALDNKMSDMPDEYVDFMQRLKKHQIEGIVFLSGDIHYSELTMAESIPKTVTQKEPFEFNYPLYEFTVSALTSYRDIFVPIHNDSRFDQVKMLGDKKKTSLYKKNNFGSIKISGPANNRACTLALFKRNGNGIWTYSINANDLKIR